MMFDLSKIFALGMASNPLFIIPDFFCIFQTNFAMATLGLKEMGKFLWEGREKGLPCWLSQFSKTYFSLPSQKNFPISFKPKVAIAEFIWKMQRKTWYSILELDAMPLSSKNLLLDQKTTVLFCLKIQIVLIMNTMIL